MRLPSYFLLLVFFVSALLPQTACEAETDNGYTGEYFEGKEQAAKTDIVDSLQNEDKKDLTDLGIHRPGDIEFYDRYLYVPDIKDRRVYKIEEKSLRVVDTIGNGRGEGPGEAERVKSIDVDNGEIIVPDARSRKIIIFSTDGDLKNEVNTKSFPPTVAEPISKNRILVSTDARPGTSKFILSDRNGNVIKSFIEVGKNANLLKFNDDISSTKEGFYVAGFSEPILKKFSLDGEPKFSRHTVNNIPTLYNYNKSRLGDEQVRYSYSNNALYASYGVTNIGDHLYVLPIHNKDGTPRKLIDVYECESGDYLRSYKTQGNVINLTHARENQIYALERINEKTFLTNYYIPHGD